MQQLFSFIKLVFRCKYLHVAAWPIGPDHDQVISRFKCGYKRMNVSELTLIN